MDRARAIRRVSTHETGFISESDEFLTLGIDSCRITCIEIAQYNTNNLHAGTQTSIVRST